MVRAGRDDLPVLWAHLDRLGLHSLLDEPVPTPGKGVGVRLGWVGGVWVPPRLSAGDHRRHPVVPWATPRRHTLQEGTGQPGHPVDGSDDRVATVLEALRVETQWPACEGALNQHTLGVYALPPAGGRLARSSASGDGSVPAAGRCPWGPRTDHRPDLPQVTILGSAWEPLGMPVAPDVVPGQRADAPLYIPSQHAGAGGPEGLWAAGGG